jgi:C1A family cysteine protease
MEEPISAPLSQEFIEIKKPTARTMSVSENALGTLPDNIDFSHYKLKSSELFGVRETYPVSYDLRDYASVTPVRDQGVFGTCWTFGTIASTEGYMKGKFSRDEDYSEKNTVNKCGWVVDENTGGNSRMVAAYSFAQRGFVDESDDPYPTGLWSTSPDGLTRQVHMKEFRILPFKQNDTDLDEMKKHLTTYGPVTISMMWDNAYYNATNYAFYNDGSVVEPEGGHCVCCIGWDDNFSRANFNVDPGIDGALLIKNSWSSSWGDSGYFWLSYADVEVGYSSSGRFFNLSIPEESFPYTGIYQHDLNGWVSNKGYTEADSWGGKIFQVEEGSDPLSAVNLITTQGNQSFDIQIFKDPASYDPTSGSLVYSSDVENYTYAGYHTYKLPYEISLDDCSSFSISIHFHYVDYSYLIGCEVELKRTDGSDYVNPSPISVGQSFVSSTGTSWYDASNSSPHYHVCIKALTGPYVNNSQHTSTIVNSQKIPIVLNGSRCSVCYHTPS